MNSPVNIYWARFSSVATLLSLHEYRFDMSVMNSSNTINSDLVSLAVMDRDVEDFQQLSSPLVLTFSLQDPGMSSSSGPRCVFMNVTATSYKHRWSSLGCLTVRSNSSHVVCHCYHLTNFAILMDVYEIQEDIDSTHDVILTYISYVGGCLSVIACVATIATFQYLGLSNDRVRIHQQLGVSIIMVQVLFICVVNTGPDSGTPVWGCRTVAILMHYSLTAMFCWMLVEGIHLYVVLVRVFKVGSNINKYTVLGWGVPVIVVGISVGAFYSRYGTSGDLCWLDHDLLLICFVPSVGLVLMINTVVLIIVIRVMVKSNSANKNSSNNKVSSRDQDRSHTSMGLKAAVVLLPLLGLTWVLAFLELETRGSHAVQYVFTYLFTLTNSFQGVLFFVFHCLLNMDVHNAYNHRHRRRKSLSYLDTMTSRRQDGSPDFYNNHPHRQLSRNTSKHTNTTRSTLTELSMLDQHRPEPHMDKLPILHLEDSTHGSTPRISGLWARMSHHPDYASSAPDFRNPFFPYTGSRRYTESDDVISAGASVSRSHVSVPRSSRRSEVRFT